MFGDFTTLIVDQLLQHACKFAEMFGRSVKVPINIRTPMGGRRGYGATHSQSLERLFIGIPNLWVFSPNHRNNVEELYQQIFSLDSPSLIAEHKLGYGLDAQINKPSGYELLASSEQFPTILYRPVGQPPVLTLLVYGYGVHIAEKVMAILAKQGIWIELVAPSKISPLNVDPILKSVIRTGRFVCYEEGSYSHGIGAACIAYVCSQGLSMKNSPILLGNNSHIPAAPIAESALLMDEYILADEILKGLERSHG
jgi:2-oxoisovalerate dehydrogenase E1 component